MPPKLKERPSDVHVDNDTYSGRCTLAVRLPGPVDPHMERYMREYMERALYSLQRDVMRGTMGKWPDEQSTIEMLHRQQHMQAMMQSQYMSNPMMNALAGQGQGQQATTATQAVKKTPNKKLLLCEV